MKIGIVVFPGSNCDHDMFYSYQNLCQQDVQFVWHKEVNLTGYDLVIVPGGFSFGDYLRPGAIAKFSPIMKEVIHFAKQGRPVVGICNGFQILCESGLLPGVLLRNQSLKFECQYVNLRVENSNSLFTNECKTNEILTVPIAHGDGNYYCDKPTLEELRENNQVLFRYVTRTGDLSPEANPNGSLDNIAGVMNRGGNVMGMMPHPERAADPTLQSTDGKKILLSLLR